jgi:hypothetical protein
MLGGHGGHGGRAEADRVHGDRLVALAEQRQHLAVYEPAARRLVQQQQHGRRIARPATGIVDLANGQVAEAAVDGRQCHRFSPSEGLRARTHRAWSV